MRLPASCAIVLCLAAASPVSGANCETGTAPNVCLLIPDGSTSDDVSPYCFLKALPRGQHTSNYAVTAQDSSVRANESVYSNEVSVAVP